MPVPSGSSPSRAHERCAAASRARGEGTAGTLGHFDVGVFIEGFRAFPRLALESIAPRLYAFNLETWQRFRDTGQGLHPRFLPIRRDGRRPGGSFSVFFSLPLPDRPPLPLRYDLTDYDALSDFDFTVMRDRPLDFAAHRDPTFRVIVCTHGKVDPCCAVDGNAVYRRLRDRDDVEAWHGAHFGGCRFAANVWCLPSGNCYGHVSTANIDALVDAERDGRVYEHGFRGRIGQSGPAAAAEHFARRHYDVWALDALSVACELDRPDSCAVRVRTTGGTVAQHRLSFAPDPERYLMTCRAVEPTSPMRLKFEAA